MAINIPHNDYVQEREIREEVVQAICETFLYESVIPNVFHPYSDGYGRPQHRYLVRFKSNKTCYSFSSSVCSPNITDYIAFRGVEMREAFKELIKAGYFMFRVYRYKSWMGYVCLKKPFLQDGTRVTEFNDFID